jgi:PGF-pre-PGF domain-containing protein
LAVVSTLLVVAAALSVGGAAMVSAQELPASYYGDVEIEGEPASDGIEVIAAVNGEDRGSLTVEDGSYGGSSSTDEKLLVQGDDIESGDEVTFYINGDDIKRTQVDSTDPSTVEWSAGEIQQVDLTVDSVEEVDDGDDDGDGGGGGGGGGGGAAPAPAPAPEIEGDAVAQSSFDGRTLSTQIESASAGSSVTASLNDDTVNNNLQNTGAALNSLTTTLANDVSNANVDTTYSATNPSEDVPDLSSQTNAEEVAYVNVDTNVEEDDIDSVTFEFSVSRDRLSNAGLSPEEIALYRFNDGEYEEYDASIDSEGDDRVTYTAEVPGLSVFAIGEETDQATATATPAPDTATPAPDTATPAPDTDTPQPDVESPAPPDDGPGAVLIGGVVIVVLAVAVGAYLAFGRE